MYCSSEQEAEGCSELEGLLGGIWDSQWRSIRVAMVTASERGGTESVGTESSLHIDTGS